MRYLSTRVTQDLRRKMVFVGGPRQCGKTTMAKALLAKLAPRDGLYLSWDSERGQRRLLAQEWLASDRLIVMDELHKFDHWKNWIKGVFDEKPSGQQILVTGSARLDVYRRGGDSLLGRYHYWRLHPFCLGELPEGMTLVEGTKRLLTLGGFPEPFLENDAAFARRWRRERVERVLSDDVRDLESLRNLSTLRLFVAALRQRVGSLIVMANLAQDLQVSAKTLVHWLDVLERMYLIFVVRPYVRNLPRAVQKPPKVYFYDNMDVLGDARARFENLVATHLLKRLQFYEDSTGYAFELCYVRDKEGREVDFVIVKDGVAHALVEAKWSETDVSRSLRYYHERLAPAKAIQVVCTLPRSFDSQGVHVRNPGDTFTKVFPLADPPAA